MVIRRLFASRRAGEGESRICFGFFLSFRWGNHFGQQLSPPVLAIIVVINGPAMQRQRASPNEDTLRAFPSCTGTPARRAPPFYPSIKGPLCYISTSHFPFCVLSLQSVPICITTTRLPLVIALTRTHCLALGSLSRRRLIHPSPRTHSRLSHSRNTFFGTQLTTSRAS